jgi:hypothetical protein
MIHDAHLHWFKGEEEPGVLLKIDSGRLQASAPAVYQAFILPFQALG